MKKLVKIGFILFFIVALHINSFGAQQSEVIVNGHPLELKNDLLVRNGKVYISVRDIGEALDYEFSWSQANKTANLKGDDLIIALQPNNRWLSKKRRDGSVTTYKFNAEDVPIFINNNIYVPIGNFAIVAEGKVGWDNNSKTYHIIYGKQLDYIEKASASLYAGTGSKGFLDGKLKEAQFKFAQSICTTKNGEVYVSDSGTIRKIHNGIVETLKTPSSTVKITLLRGNTDLFGLSKAYINENKKQVYSIFKVEGDCLKEVYTQKSAENKIIDFDIISSDIISSKEICVLKEEIKNGKRYLEIVDFKSGSIMTSLELDTGFDCLVAGGERIYLGNSKNGSIYSYDLKQKTLNLFAGTENKYQFVDGSDPLFCSPRRLKYNDNTLYVLDYNVLRKMSITSDGRVRKCQTIAGEDSVLMDSQIKDGYAKDLRLSPINTIDFAISGNNILLTDASQFKIVEIRE